MKTWRQRLAHIVARAIRWGDAHVPTGLRTLLGIAAMAGGVVGFLPILGFWMLPVGLALIALDVPPLRRRLLAWAARQNDYSRNSRSAFRPAIRRD